MKGRLEVRAHPGARSDGVRGWLADGTLKVDVTAPPAEGRANRAVEALLASLLGIPRGGVTVVSGLSSRRKLVEVQGLDDGEIRRRMESALGRDRGGH